MLQSFPALPQEGHPLPGVISAGQPDVATFRALRSAGLRRVINLRPTTEDPGFDQAALMVELGFDYRVLPVATAADLSLDTVREFDAALTAGEGPVLVHCASANRVGALLALRAAWLQGQTPEAALALGARGGLTRMHPVVEALISRGPTV